VVAFSEPDLAPVDWYSARLKILVFIEGEGAVDTNLVVHVFRAADWDDAFRRALELGVTHNRSYKNNAGETVEWRFAEVLTLDNLGNAPDLDGREVHSLVTGESDPLPFDTSLSPEDSDPGQTGVPFLNLE
jgi:hypothetical protein